jgi:hypothetical protein
MVTAMLSIPLSYLNASLCPNEKAYIYIYIYIPTERIEGCCVVSAAVPYGR